MGDPGEAVQVWLDKQLPTDVPPGTAVYLGVTLWDQAHQRLVPAQSTEYWWRPALGEVVAPDRGILTEDWLGHGTAEIVVPTQGIGALEIGFTGTSGTRTGGLEPDNTIFPICGVGPPPDAPLPLVARATLDLAAPIVAGQESVAMIALQPNADWEPGTFRAPSQLLLRARLPRGSVDASVPANLVDASAGRYRATITLTEPGAYILEAASSTETGGTFSSSAQRVNVVANASAAPTNSGSGPGVLLPVLLLVGAVVVVAVVVLVIRREW